MKTPLTQLIERLEAMQAAAPHIERNVYTKAIREAKELLDEEELAIKNAWINSSLEWDGSEEDIFGAIEYFNKTYPQPIKTLSTDND